MAKKEERLATILVKKELLDRIKIRAAVEGTTVKNITEQLIADACPPVSAWTVKKQKNVPK
jgi:hypothetical protein